VAVQAGADVVVREISQDLVDRGLAGIERNLDRLFEKGALTTEARDAARTRLRGTTRLEDLADADLVVEAIVEQLAAKREVFGALERLCPKATIFASNTSSLSITELAAATGRPDRFLGLHFFNPVPMMKLVEVIPTIATDPRVVNATIAFVERLGKRPVRTADRTGFIVNRLLVPYLLDAIRVLDEGLATTEDIDTAMTLGCGHPMGPLTLADFIGLDTTYHIATVMFDEFKEPRFAPPPLLRRMILTGWTGRKGGRGFYDYADPKAPRPSALRAGDA
ncbi:MAG: 3-hydroxyacyl-CoA dehydrogenase NAD-binding domain-containing protein, partial [Chloroflexi bacterium]|nr:3-hydroxyacyl-CoA dehydrogenase NAD-binding domain-containing protein [Chloroflexota bacterium]